MAAQPWIKTSVNISPEFYKLARQHFIKFSDAMRTGIAILLAEKGVVDYDTNLNITRRINELKLKAQQYAQKAANLQDGNR